MKETKKILITGGHLTPAVAVIQEIRRQKLPWHIVFVGRAQAFEGGSAESEEKKTVESFGIRFVPITTGRLTRVISMRSVIALSKIPVGFVGALIICLRERPHAILSFGGYVALPLVIIGYMLGIPVVTHEQTTVPGLANRVIGWFAKNICITFPDTDRIFQPQKTIHTGLPIRDEVLKFAAKQNNHSMSAPLVLYITGGSTGSVSLNQLIFPIIKALTSSYLVYHQTGDLSYETALKIRSGLQPENQQRYVIERYFDGDSVASVFLKSDLIIGRSGANTVMEAAVFGIPALFVPLPWSGGREQETNARWFASHGAALVLNQNNATPEVLLAYIHKLIAKRGEFTKNAQSVSHTIPKDGAASVIQVLSQYV